LYKFDLWEEEFDSGIVSGHVVCDKDRRRFVEFQKEYLHTRSVSVS